MHLLRFYDIWIVDRMDRGRKTHCCFLANDNFIFTWHEHTDRTKWDCIFIDLSNIVLSYHNMCNICKRWLESITNFQANKSTSSCNVLFDFKLINPICISLYMNHTYVWIHWFPKNSPQNRQQCRPLMIWFFEYKFAVLKSIEVEWCIYATAT